MEKPVHQILSIFAREITKNMRQRPSTREEYLKQVNIVVEYINNHLDECIELQTLADLSNVSPFHFQRIMKAFLGEPIGAFIVRMRVETAAQLIRHTDLPIREIAYRVGYDTPSSLTKVFRQFYAVSPTEYRNNKNFMIMRQVLTEAKLNIKKAKEVTIESKQAIYIRAFGQYSTLDYNGIWGRLWAFVKENKLFTAGMEHIGIYHDDPKVTDPDKLRSDLCLTIHKPAKPQGETGIKEIKGGKFAVFEYEGSYEFLSQVYDTIYCKLLPEGGFRLRDAGCFEIYKNDPNRTDPDKLKTAIYVPVE